MTTNPPVDTERHKAIIRQLYREVRGEWKGLPATGRRVEVHEMLLFRFEEGRIAEVWEVVDEHSLRQQLRGGSHEGA